MSDDIKQIFIEEATELLTAMEDALLAMEEDPEDEEHLNSVFRAMHTIKGSAGLFALDKIVEFTHPVETELDKVRSGERPLDSDFVAILLDCRDHTAQLVDLVMNQDPNQLSEELQQQGERLLKKILGNLPASSGGAVVEHNSGVEKEGGSGSASTDNWLISLQFKADALRNGLDPLSFLRYLKNMGEIVDIVTLSHTLPAFADMDPESCYLGFRIEFHSSASKKDIEAVFEFAEDDCDIRILAPDSQQRVYLELLEDLADEDISKVGDILIHIGALTEKELRDGLDQQFDQIIDESEGEHEPNQPIGEILVERHVVDQPLVDKAIEKQQKAKDKASQEARYIRVDSAKLGQLINLVGELVISSAAMKMMVEKHSIDEVEEVVYGVESLVENIRDTALELRMVQIGDTFSRFRRVVRDVSKGLDKEIELKITGGETELDKTVVEKINDPLTHIVRNSLDHGIEMPADREAKGKPRTGTLELNAYHDSGHIVIQITDDGQGLDPERIRQKAIANGLITETQELTREEIFRLAFSPGLSTKDQASNLSGRGVGMDVVKRNIEALRGSVELDSEPGQGTTVTINLPLTLAIIDGFMVGSAGDQFIIPLSMVEECVEMDSGEWEIDHHRKYVNLRGEVMPYIRLCDFFGAKQKQEQEQRYESLVVVRFGREKAGFVVDELFGEMQTVIKPLGKVFEHLKGVSGATILGSGAIALILDVQGLINLAHQQSQQQVRHLHAV